MWETSVWTYLRGEALQLLEWAKCGESALSVIPTLLWALGAAALAQRLLATLFRRFLFRRVPLWEIILQHLLFVWMLIYSLQFWIVFVKCLKIIVDYYYEDDELTVSEEDIGGRKLVQQWAVWMCGAAPLAFYIHTRPRPELPPLMLWITTSPWQRREMGPYGYYLNRPLSNLQSSTNLGYNQSAVLRRAFSESRVLIKQPAKKKRHSKSI